MLATRSRRDAEDEEEQVPLTSQFANGAYTETSLFEGLSFPEVPKSSIRRETGDNGAAYRPAPQTDNNDMEMVTFSAEIPSAPPAINYVGESISHPLSHHAQPDIYNPVADTREPSVPAVKGSLSTLYASTEIITSEPDRSWNHYPEVPSLSVGTYSTPSSSSMQTAARSTTSIPLQERFPTIVAGPITSSTATVSAPAAAPATVRVEAAAAAGNNTTTSQRPVEQAATSNHLIDELLQENSRLTEEVQSLRRLVAHQQSTVAATTTTTGQRQNLAQSPATGQQVADTTNPPAAGVKYVCCGACRQWLLAPKEATYVVCSRCQAVNNCALTPMNQRGPNNEDPANYLYRRSSLNSFLDCLTRPFQG